jgi:hypothetical protein
VPLSDVEDGKVYGLVYSYAIIIQPAKVVDMEHKLKEQSGLIQGTFDIADCINKFSN